MSTVQRRIGAVDPPAEAVREELTRWGLAGWNVRKDPLVALDGTGTVAVRGLFAVIRDDPATSSSIGLGVVGNHNSPIQNEQQAELLMRIVGVPRLEFLDAGAVGDGHQVYLVGDLPTDIEIDAGRLGIPPIHAPFEIVTLNHHDGSGALWFYVLPAGTWDSALRPLFGSHGVRPSGTRWIADHAVTMAHLRHNASRRGIAGKLRRDLGLERRGGGALATL